MAIHLPRPIDIYFTLDRARDTEALATGFAADATVRDEGRTHEGRAAIEAWEIEARRKYEYTIEPLEAAHRVTARPSSPPESPATFPAARSSWRSSSCSSATKSLRWGDPLVSEPCDLDGCLE